MPLFFSDLLNEWPVLFLWIAMYRYGFDHSKEVKCQLLIVTSSRPFFPVLKGYLPANKERRELVLQRKREEYFGFIEQYYHSRTDEHYKDTYRQVEATVSPQLRPNKDQDFPSSTSSPKLTEYHPNDHHFYFNCVALCLLVRSTSTFQEPTLSSPCSSSRRCKR